MGVAATMVGLGALDGFDMLSMALIGMAIRPLVLGGVVDRVVIGVPGRLLSGTPATCEMGLPPVIVYPDGPGAIALDASIVTTRYSGGLNSSYHIGLANWPSSGYSSRDNMGGCSWR